MNQKIQTFYQIYWHYPELQKYLDSIGLKPLFFPPTKSNSYKYAKDLVEAYKKSFPESDLANLELLICPRPLNYNKLARAVLCEIPAIIILDKAFYSLSSLFFHLFSRQKIFPSVGESVLESTEALFGQYRIFDINCYGDHDLDAPKCSKRKSIALFTAEIVHNFLVEHELVHFTNGHLKYLNAVGDTPELRQTLEYDADWCAAQHLLKNLIAIEREIEKGNISRSSEINDFYEAITYLIFGINCYFGAEQILNSTGAEKRIKKTHPALRIRMIMVPTSIIGYCQHRLPEVDQTRLAAAIDQGLINSFTALCAMYPEHHQHLIEASTKSFTSEEEYLELDNANKRWEEIRDDLQKFSILKLPPAKAASFLQNPWQS